jgi:hypothetical protein
MHPTPFSINWRCVKKHLLIKIAVGVLAIGAFAVLFMRSLEDTRTAAYTVDRRHLSPWTLALETASAPHHPLLVLRASPELATGLFKQIFSRAMESLNSPTSPSIALVLRGEFDRVVGDRLTQEAMLAAARASGLETAAPTPRCLVHRRISEPGGVRQVYLVFFDAPRTGQFRQQIGLDPDALSPVMIVAGGGPDFNSWLPLRVNADSDCLAPIEIAP